MTSSRRATVVGNRFPRPHGVVHNPTPHRTGATTVPVVRTPVVSPGQWMLLMPPEPLDYQTQPGAPRPRCPACGSDRTVKGKLAGEAVFQPLKIRKFFTVSGTLRVD